MADQEKQTADTAENTKQVQTTEKKTLTNIYYDCLERIFEFLDLENLLNVADTCKRLQIGAAHYFGENFSNKKIYMDMGEINGNVPAIVDRSASITILRPDIALAMLRCFGNKMKELCLFGPNTHSGHLGQYIIQYCGDALTNIGFEGWLPVLPIEGCERPLKNVKRFLFRNVALKDQLRGISHCFPSIELLLLADVSFDDDFIAVHLPHLKCLHIVSSDAPAKGLISFLGANRHLKALVQKRQTGTAMSLSTLLEMINGNSTIMIIDISLRAESPTNAIEPINVNGAELGRLVNEHPSIGHLRLPEYQFTADDAIALIRRFIFLSEFKFNVLGQSEYDRFIGQLDKKWKCDLNVISDVHTIQIKRN